MFPQTNDLLTTIEKLQESSTVETVVKTSLAFDFDTKKFTVVDGNPVTNADIEATKQWIRQFFKTDKDTVPVYNGTNFGTSARKLLGNKVLNNGFYESEVEREVREGFPLCPTIKQVTSFNMEKIGRILKIYVSVELFDGTLLDQEETINA